MSKYKFGGLLSSNIGEVSSVQLNGHTVRREVSVVDGTKFFRFTLDPGISGEFGTMWGDNEDALLRLVYRKAGVAFHST